MTRQEMHQKMANIANLFSLSPLECVALPAVVARMANSVQMTEAAFIGQCERNLEVAAYVAKVCRDPSVQSVVKEIVK